MAHDKMALKPGSITLLLSSLMAGFILIAMIAMYHVSYTKKLAKLMVQRQVKISYLEALRDYALSSASIVSFEKPRENEPPAQPIALECKGMGESVPLYDGRIVYDYIASPTDVSVTISLLSHGAVQASLSGLLIKKGTEWQIEGARYILIASNN